MKEAAFVPFWLFGEGARFDVAALPEKDNSLRDLLAGQGRVAVARLDGASSDTRKDRISDKPVWYSFNLLGLFFPGIDSM
ncbi:hypothetical protein FHS76_001584 [Ochrobactrum daejeonense]|uniref:Uncharacterized protein n=1 Tax=Brucella daejeonensis TaxID=659015 RepID=A0A7W9AWI8_9HYPH|nr:hypothetical protein [Brucella daejeonensis]MBB5701722.1 hypothetical protein [Brucella daejeonensis]